jgi:AMMECR1 domain-containing protein
MVREPMANGKPVTKVELDSAVGDLRTAIRTQKDELVDAMRQIETNLLTEFHRYAKGQNARVHNVEVGKLI